MDLETGSSSTGVIYRDFMLLLNSLGGFLGKKENRIMFLINLLVISVPIEN